MSFSHARLFKIWGPCAVAIVLLAADGKLHATPQFARTHGLTCNSCHSVVPRLNANGLAFAARGYRRPELIRSSSQPEGGVETAPRGTAPLSGWITLRYEDRGGSNANDLYLPKVEAISGGPLGKSLAYFVEWRLVSEALNNDGTFTDRSGRFEDAFLDWSLPKGNALKFGQFRLLNQVDVSQRLSVDEPLLFNNALATGSSTDPRIAGLERFSPSGRSPSVGWAWRSRAGQTASDGLFHFVTIPFAGEFSIPLTPAAETAASFELEGPKGVYAETFYRRGLRSVGGNAFYDEQTWLATLVGTHELGPVSLTGGAGYDQPDGSQTRLRASLEGEWLIRRSDSFRTAIGARVENVSHDDRRERYIPYVVLAFPNSTYTFLLQAQYVSQQGSDTLVFDLSTIF